MTMHVKGVTCPSGVNQWALFQNLFTQLCPVPQKSMRQDIGTVVWETTTEQLETLKAAKFGDVLGFAKLHTATYGR